MKLEGIEMVDFGKRLRELRKNNGLTQKDLAEQLSLTKSVISAYENDIRLPSYDVLLAISRIFKVSTDYLLGQSKIEADIIESRKQYADMTGLTEREMELLRNLIHVIKESRNEI